MKRDFTVKLKSSGRKTKTFKAKGCKIKKHSAPLAKHIKETIECDEYKID
jgi:hypothetical protein